MWFQCSQIKISESTEYLHTYFQLYYPCVPTSLYYYLIYIELLFSEIGQIILNNKDISILQKGFCNNKKRVINTLN